MKHDLIMEGNALIAATSTSTPYADCTTMKVTAFVFSLVLIANAPPAAPDWVLRDHAYQAFLIDLQSAIRAGNRPAVVKLIDLPLRVNGPNGHSQTYRSAISIQRDYTRIFTGRVRSAILQQRFEELFARDLGVMIGNGEVWVDHTCPNSACAPRGPVQIKAVNR